MITHGCSTPEGGSERRGRERKGEGRREQGGKEGEGEEGGGKERTRGGSQSEKLPRPRRKKMLHGATSSSGGGESENKRREPKLKIASAPGRKKKCFTGPRAVREEGREKRRRKGKAKNYFGSSEISQFPVSDRHVEVGQHVIPQSRAIPPGDIKKMLSGAQGSGAGGGKEEGKSEKLPRLARNFSIPVNDRHVERSQRAVVEEGRGKEEKLPGLPETPNFP
jgi:hypothetical protein